MAVSKLTTLTPIVGQFNWRTRYCHGNVNTYKQAFEITFVYLQNFQGR